MRTCFRLGLWQMCVYIYIYMYVCMYVCMYAYIYIYSLYIYIHIILYCIMLYHVLLYIILHYTIYTISYHSISYHTTLYYIIVDHIILYQIVSCVSLCIYIQRQIELANQFDNGPYKPTLCCCNTKIGLQMITIHFGQLEDLFWCSQPSPPAQKIGSFRCGFPQSWGYPKTDALYWKIP